jgi:hypothetical protein
MCHDCGLRPPSYGLAADRTKRWCGPCKKKAHPEAVRKGRRLCEDCKEKVSYHGMPGDTDTRWCKGCAAAHEGSGPVGQRKCDDCQLKQPSFGLAADGKPRWCKECSRAHGGVDVVNNWDFKAVRRVAIKGVELGKSQQRMGDKLREETVACGRAEDELAAARQEVEQLRRRVAQAKAKFSKLKPARFKCAHHLIA